MKMQDGEKFSKYREGVRIETRTPPRGDVRIRDAQPSQGTERRNRPTGFPGAGLMVRPGEGTR